MKAKCRCLGLGLGLLGLLGAASGRPALAEETWTVEEQEYWTKAQEEIDKHAALAAEQCGNKITASYAKDTFKGRLTNGGPFGLSGYDRAKCYSSLGALNDMCLKSPIAKKAIAAKVLKVECRFGAKGKFDTAFSGTTLVVTYEEDINGGQTAERVTNFVKKKL